MKRILLFAAAALVMAACVFAGSGVSETVSGWPAERFPDVPPFPGPVMTKPNGDTAVVYPSDDTDPELEEYGALLIDSGFDLYVYTGVMSVYSKNGTDVVLIRDTGDTEIRLLAEPECAWGTDEYLTPPFGRYVSAEETDAGTVLTVRGAAPDRVLEYFDSLVAAGWKREQLFTPPDCTAYGIFTKRNRVLTVDYYSLGYDFTVTMGTDK